ncbi:hypothetical protein LCGC14_2982100, partial [marine sediment metagenome]
RIDFERIVLSMPDGTYGLFNLEGFLRLIEGG